MVVACITNCIKTAPGVKDRQAQGGSPVMLDGINEIDGRIENMFCTSDFG